MRGSAGAFAEGTAEWGDEGCDRGLRVDCDGGQRRLTAHEVLDELAEPVALWVTGPACKVAVRGAARQSLLWCASDPAGGADPVPKVP